MAAKRLLLPLNPKLKALPVVLALVKGRPFLRGQAPRLAARNWALPRRNLSSPRGNFILLDLHACVKKNRKRVKLYTETPATTYISGSGCFTEAQIAASFSNCFRRPTYQELVIIRHLCGLIASIRFGSSVFWRSQDNWIIILLHGRIIRMGEVEVLGFIRDSLGSICVGQSR